MYPPSTTPAAPFPGGFPRRPLPPVNPLIYLFPFVAIILFTFFSSGCDRANLPSAPGDYAIQNNEIHFDGQHYNFRWIDKNGQIHYAETDNIKLVQDDHTFLRVDNNGAVLHMAENQAVQVDGRDNRGNFVTPWYPFFWGPLGGGPVIVVPPDVGGNSGTPGYRYPPSDSFGRGDTLGGNVQNSKPQPPSYTNIPNASNTVGGQAGGTGGGAAATGKTDRPASGQSGGTGTGSAASDKGGFRTGPSAYDQNRNNGSVPSITGGSSGSSSDQPRVGAGGAGSSGGLQSPRAGSGTSSAPNKPSTGSKGISGSGGRRR